MKFILSFFNFSYYSDFHILVLFLLLALGLYVLIQGSNFNVFGASKIARVLHISEFVIGITVVAFSTSLPEFFISIRSGLKGDGVIALANVIGSNTFNIAFIFMILCLFSKDVFRIKWKSILFLSAINVALLIIEGMQIVAIPRWVGVVFISMLIMHIHNLYRTHKKEELNARTGQSKEEANLTIAGSDKNAGLAILIASLEVLLGGLFLYVGTELFLNSAKELGYRINISDQIIGVVFVAVGTGLPELMVTLTAIYHMKKNTRYENFQDMAEGNVLGSNLFNLLGVLGLTTVISPLEGLNTLLPDLLVMSGFTLLLFMLLAQKLYMQKILGIILLLSYISYIFLLFT